MSEYKLDRNSVQLSQNFLTSSKTVKNIVNLADINKNDHIIEIGAGKGHITSALIRKSKYVTALEIDGNLYDYLKNKFKNDNNVKLVCIDFFKYKLPRTPYKIFANIPYNKTNDIVKKLMLDPNPPDKAWLVMQKEAAIRFMGKPRENLISLLLKPNFDLKIKYYFNREDFHPLPSVNSVLLYFSKKSRPDILRSEYTAYKKFTINYFKYGNINLTEKQISRALKSERLTDAELYCQWLCLFRYMKYKTNI